MKHIRFSAFFFAILITLLIPTEKVVAKKKQNNRPNILVIITDQQNSRMMSCTGNKWLKTPAMDALAKEGIRFENAYCTNPVCCPSRTSMATGIMPNRLGAIDNETGMKIKDLPTEVNENSLGKIVKRSGYDTFYGGKVHMCSQLQPENAGYDEYFKDERDDLPAACLKFITRKRANPFFAVTSFINPHDICFAYRAYNGVNTQNVIDLYKEASSLPLNQLPPLPANFKIPEKEPKAIKDHLRPDAITPPEIMRKDYNKHDWRIYSWIYRRLTERVDEQIGVILDGLKKSGLEDNTLIIFTSDHGNMDARHKLASKGFPYEESVGVPLILKYKDVIPADMIDSDHLVSTGLDLLPTICDYVGADIPAYLLGKSLRPLAEGSSEYNWRRSYVVSENGWFRVIRSSRYKYAVCLDNSDKKYESLVDIKNDPGEMINIATKNEYKDVLMQHREYLKEWSKISNDGEGAKFLIGGKKLE